MANLDKLKLFPNQLIDGDANECVALTIADICGNADGRTYDPDFTYAMEPRLTGALPNNGGRDPRMSMLATVAYGLLPTTEETFTAKTMGDLYVANYLNYSPQQIKDALACAPKGIINLYTYDDIVAYLAKYGRGASLRMDWHDSFNRTNSSGILPAPSGAITSHNVAVYEDTNAGLRIKPWLGPDFGDGGYAYLSRAQFPGVFKAGYGFDPNGIRMVTLLYITALRLPYLMSYLPNLIAALASPAPAQPSQPKPATPPVAPQAPDTAPQQPEPAPAPSPAPAAPQKPVYDWSTPAAARHSVRLICDEVLPIIHSFIVDGKGYLPKDVLCACIEQESGFMNHRPDGTPVENINYVADGKTIASIDWGICQINDYWHIGPGKDFPTVAYVLAHPDEAVRFMARMFAAGKADLWSSYTSGAFKKYLPAT